MAIKRPIALTVLDTVQAAAADITFAGNKLTVTGLGRTVNLADATSYSYTAYAAGTPSVKEYNFAAATLGADLTYRLAVIIDGQIDFNGGGKEANELIPIREYTISSGSTVPTAAFLATEFITRINLDPNAKVTAASGGAGIVELTLNTAEFGDFRVESPLGVVEAVTTPFVAPAGTPAIVEADRGQANPAGAYDTYLISFDDERRHNAVAGGYVGYPEDVKIYIESTDGNTVAFLLALDDILDGSHTPVADYLGV